MKKERYFKRFCAALLAVVLCVCLMSPGVYATESGTEETTAATAATEVQSTIETTDNTQATSAASETEAETQASGTDLPTEETSAATEGTEAIEETTEALNETEAAVNAILLGAGQTTIEMSVTLGRESLSGADASINGWEYGTSKELVVTVKKDVETTCTVQIDLPMQVYATSYTGTEGGATLSFTDLADTADFEDLSVYTNRSYSTAVGYYATYRSGGAGGSSPSGTWTYVIDENTTEITINMMLQYDASLWSNVAGDEVLTGGAAVSVAAYEGSVAVGDPVSQVCLTSITAGTSTMSYRSMMYYKCANAQGFASTQSYLAQDEGIVVEAFFDQWTENTTYLYYTSVKLTVTYPSYTTTDGGTTYYLVYDESNSQYKNQMIYFNRTATPTTANTELTMTVNTASMIMPNSSSATSAYISMIPLCLQDGFEEDAGNTTNLYEFTGGKVKLTGITSSGQEVTIYEKDINTITYKGTNYVGEEDVQAEGVQQKVTVDLPEDAVTLLGGVKISNQGADESIAKTITMEFDSALLVTDINLLADTTQENITVTYTLKDAAGTAVEIGGQSKWTIEVPNTYYESSKTGDELCLALNQTMLPSDQQDYYFDSVSYTIESIAAQTNMYNSSSYAFKTSPGNYFGRLASGVTDGTTLHTTTTITAAGLSDVTANSTTVATTDNTSGYGIQNVAMSSTAVESGNQITLTGTILVRGDYTGGTNTVLRDIHLGVVLPEGVAIGSASLSGGAVACSVTKTDTYVGDGYVLYLIQPKDTTFYIGYYSVGLGAAANDGDLAFSLTLTTTQGMESTTLNSYEMLYVWGGDNQQNSPGGVYLWMQRTDTYDLNNNGSTVDKIGGMAAAGAPTCTITTTGGALDSSESLEVNGSGSGSTVTLAAASDTTTQTLSFTNNKSGTASGLVYYIPVPKTGVTGSDFISQVEFDYSVVGASSIQVTSNTITDLSCTVYVTTDVLTSYSAASSYTGWVSADDAGIDWSAVQMIKVVVGSSIARGDDLTIAVDFSYAGDGTNYAYYAGMTNVWCWEGSYTYALGSKRSASLQTTAEQTALLTYVATESVELTAEKNMDPSADVHTDTATVSIGISTGFENVQNLQVESVSVQNVQLKDVNTITTNASTMSSSEANEQFALTLDLNGGTAVDLSDGTATALGNTVSSQNTLTLTLYNGDALTDTTTERTVTIVLTGTTNSGTIEDVRFTINLTINRIEAGVTAETAIDTGKQYKIFQGNAANAVTINSDSAFTAQFYLSYVPNSLTDDRILKFDNVPPDGAELMLIVVPCTDDGLEDTTQSRAYYTYTSKGENNIDLTAFTKMGSTESYTIPTGSSMIYETLLLVVDFSGCSASGSYTFTLSIDTNNTELTCNIQNNSRSFSLNCEGAEDAVYNTAYSITYSSVQTGASDVYYAGKRLALVVTTTDDLPDDAYLLAGGTAYYRNENGQFLIPLEQLSESSTTSGTVSIGLYAAAPTDSVTLTFELWVSATSNGEKPLAGESTDQTVEITFHTVADPSFKVTEMSSRLVSSLSDSLTVSYEYQDMSGCSVTVELQKKENGSYGTSTTDLISVNGTAPNQGIVTLLDGTQSSGSDTAAIALSASLTGTNTYRLLFKVYDGNGALISEVPYNFIVSLD